MVPMSITPPGMSVGWWIELPLGEDAEPTWAQIDVLLDPSSTGDDRWAVRVRRGRDDWWVKIHPDLWFPVCDVEPT
ncbi:MAG: hypothetical protein QOG20_3038 [Pseudonocardiales bacterium]|jgi:hypothetical protein|nr:hypothetical protein [Pseudonocardiales bacterium]